MTPKTEGRGAESGPTETAAVLIVVVDDEPSILEGLELLLDGWGYGVLTALGLAQLRERLPALSAVPRLVLADHQLSTDETGAQVVELVRAHAGSAIPAIMLTGDTTPEREAEALALGCQLLHKPVQVAALREAVEALLRD